MTDRILAFLSLAGLAAFLAVLGWFLKEVDLTIVIVSVIALAFYDFYFYRFKNSGKSGK